MRYVSPALAALRTDSFFFSCDASGIRTKNNSTRNASANVARSKISTACIPAKARNAVAMTGLRIVIRELEKDCRLLTF